MTENLPQLTGTFQDKATALRDALVGLVEEALADTEAREECGDAERYEAIRSWIMRETDAYRFWSTCRANSDPAVALFKLRSSWNRLP